MNEFLPQSKPDGQITEFFIPQLKSMCSSIFVPASLNLSETYMNDSLHKDRQI